MNRTSNDQPLKDILKSFTNDSKYKYKLTKSKILMIWADSMSPVINKYTRKIDVTKKGKVSIHIDSAPLRSELSYGKEKIKNLFNEKLEEDFVTEVHIF